MGIKCNQCPQQTVNTLLTDVRHIVKTLQQVVSAHIRYVFADSRQCKNYSCIFSGLGFIQTTVGIDIVLHILDNRVIITVGHGFACAGQADHTPLTVGTAYYGGRQAC